MPSRLKHPQIERVIDANYNRAKEGLRVCEDIFRFLRDDPKVTARFKKIRHGVTAAVSGFGLKNIVAARDIKTDVGRGTIKRESSRGDVGDIYYANAQRVKESLRVLEEFAKLKDARAADRFKKLRYEVYDIEKETLAKI